MSGFSVPVVNPTLSSRDKLPLNRCSPTLYRHRATAKFGWHVVAAFASHRVMGVTVRLADHGGRKQHHRQIKHCCTINEGYSCALRDLIEEVGLWTDGAGIHASTDKDKALRCCAEAIVR